MSAVVKEEIKNNFFTLIVFPLFYQLSLPTHRTHGLNSYITGKKAQKVTHF
jgi:hypothetical protein